MKSFLQKSFLIINLFFIAAVSFAQQFEEGKNYEVISKTESMTLSTPSSSNKVSVVEFFSYGCPWCYRLEPALETWVEDHTKQIEFSRVPVVFEQGWEIYAKAYYILKELKLENKLTKPLFEAVQQKQITSEDELKKFFLEHGVDEKTYVSAANSPVIDNETRQAAQAMSDYRIEYVPTVIVAGKYKAHIGMVDGDSDKFMELIYFLVKKASSEKAK